MNCVGPTQKRTRKDRNKNNTIKWGWQKREQYRGRSHWAQKASRNMKQNGTSIKVSVSQPYITFDIRKYHLGHVWKNSWATRTLEILAIKGRLKRNTEGLRNNYIESKISKCEDDTSFNISPASLLQNLIDLLDIFSQRSGLRLNHDKCQIWRIWQFKGTSFG